MQHFYQLVKFSLIDSWDWIHGMSDVTLDENMTRLTLPAAKQRIFNHSIQNVPILRVTS